jgi:putative ubiquitin-RnfH superfamily antitoxin RatB of RatAB toxin-antitoxin module
MSAERQELAVEVAYALPQRAVVKIFRLTAPATVAEALALAQGDPEYSGIDWDRAAVGIFGARVDRQRHLQNGDRIEIYRALAMDPKAARRARVERARATRPPRSGR